MYSKRINREFCDWLHDITFCAGIVHEKLCRNIHKNLGPDDLNTFMKSQLSCDLKKFEESYQWAYVPHDPKDRRHFSCQLFYGLDLEDSMKLFWTLIFKLNISADTIEKVNNEYENFKAMGNDLKRQLSEIRSKRKDLINSVGKTVNNILKTPASKKTKRDDLGDQDAKDLNDAYNYRDGKLASAGDNDSMLGEK